MDEGVAKGSGSPCARAALTAAYLDGELDPAASEEFESHTRSCPACSAALLEQRRLLCLLDTAFDETFEKPLALPEGFTRQVRARAQNDLSGLRGAHERRRALKICVVLGAAAFALLGFTAFDALYSAASGAAATAGGMASVAGNAASDAGAGAGVVLRALGGKLVSVTAPFALLGFTAFAVALVLLLRLIGAYHRAGE